MKNGCPFETAIFFPKKSHFTAIVATQQLNYTF